MKKILILFGFAGMICFSANAQIEAVTEKGDTILVYNDGTWTYPDYSGGIHSKGLQYEIDSTELEFHKASEATQTLNSELGFFSVHYNPEEWKRVPPGTINADAEFALLAKKGDAYCLVISEEIAIGTKNILDIALNNMKNNTGSALKVRSARWIEVNGKKMIEAKMSTRAQGIDLIFHSYFYSGEKEGTIQFTTWTGESIYSKHEDKIKNLLNGLIIHEEQDDEEE